MAPDIFYQVQLINQSLNLIQYVQRDKESLQYSELHIVWMHCVM